MRFGHPHEEFDMARTLIKARPLGAFSLLASLGAGFLWDREGPSATFLMGALAAAVALAMLSLLHDPDRRPAR